MAERERDKAYCYIDTEFNGQDFKNQNRGFQDVVQIGAVMVRGGSVVDSFSSYIRLPRGIHASKRLEALTGINSSTLREAPSFERVMKDFVAFVTVYGPVKIYSYGAEDRKRLEETMHHCRISDIQIEECIRRVTDVMPLIDDLLKRKEAHGQLSMAELCEICYVDQDEAHDAFADAKYLGQCVENLKKRKYSKKKYIQVVEDKKYRINYFNKRRVRMPLKEGEASLTPDERAAVISLIDKAKKTGKYRDFELDALRDDLLTLSGYQALYGQDMK